MTNPMRRQTCYIDKEQKHFKIILENSLDSRFPHHELVNFISHLSDIKKDIIQIGSSHSKQDYTCSLMIDYTHHLVGRDDIKNEYKFHLQDFLICSLNYIFNITVLYIDISQYLFVFTDLESERFVECLEKQRSLNKVCITNLTFTSKVLNSLKTILFKNEQITVFDIIPLYVKGNQKFRDNYRDFLIYLLTINEKLINFILNPCSMILLNKDRIKGLIYIKNRLIQLPFLKSIGILIFHYIDPNIRNLKKMITSLIQQCKRLRNLVFFEHRNYQNNGRCFDLSKFGNFYSILLYKNNLNQINFNINVKLDIQLIIEILEKQNNKLCYLKINGNDEISSNTQLQNLLKRNFHNQKIRHTTFVQLVKKNLNFNKTNDDDDEQEEEEEEIEFKKQRID